MSEKQEPKEPKNRIYFEIIGWYGAFAIVLAYALVSFKLVKSDSATYQLLNLTGAIGIIAISMVKKVRQPALLNAFWAIIAAVALIQIIL